MASVNLKSPSRDARPGCCDWFTGLPGVGKTTVANELRDALLQHAGVCIVLSGDELGKGLNHDLGFNREDRCENVRPIAQLGSILVDAGLVVPVAVIAPDREDRQAVRELVNGRGYAEAYVATTQAICVAHDPRGLYQRALDGKLNGMTDWQALDEPPLAPEIRIDTLPLDIEEGIALLLVYEPCVSSRSNRTETP